jgi:histone-binding protein RBBP4
MRVWAGDEVKVEEKELEGDAMEGVENTNAGKSGNGSGSGGAPSQRSQSMSVSATASISGLDGDED